MQAEILTEKSLMFKLGRLPFLLILLVCLNTVPMLLPKAFAQPVVEAFLEDRFFVGQCFDTVQFQVVVRNVGTDTARNVSFDLIPDANASLVVGSVAASQGTVVTGNTGGDVTISVDLDRIGDGDTARIKFLLGFNQIIYPGVTILTNQGTASGSNFANVLTTEEDSFPTIVPTITSLDSILIMPIRGPSDTTIGLGATCSYTMADFTALFSVDNFCPPLSFAQSPLPGTTIQSDTIVRVTVMDNNGRVSVDSFEITLIDTLRPIPVTQNINAYLDSSGKVKITPTEVDNGSSDNCGPVSLSLSLDSFDCLDRGANLIHLIVSDTAGNLDSSAAIITVLDTIKPVIIPFSTVEVYLNGGGIGTITITDVDSASQDNCGIETIMLSKSNFTCSDVGANSTNLTVTDSSSNSRTQTITVNVIDTFPPTAVSQNINAYLETSGKVKITAAQVDNGSSDNCGPISISLSLDSFDCLQRGPNLVQLYVTDAGLNIDSTPATITVIDTVSPLIIPYSNIEVFLNAAGTVTITPMDVDSASRDNCGIESRVLGTTNFTCSEIGANTVTYTVTDSSSNARVQGLIVNVRDTFPPMVISQNITAYFDTLGKVKITAAQVDNGSSDVCSPVILSLSQDSFDCSDRGANTIQLIASDTSGNMDSASAIVTVLDTIRPLPIPKSTINAYLTPAGNVFISPADVDSASQDNCAIESMTIIGGNFFTCGNIGPRNRAFMVTDSSSNSRTVPIVVNVIDSTKPTVITQNVTVYLNAVGIANVTPVDVDNGSFDNCGILALSISKSFYNCSDTGANTIYLSLRDINGNEDSAAAIVTVLDTISPTVNTTNVSVPLGATGTVTIPATLVNNFSFDNCAIDSFSVFPRTFSCADIGPNPVTLTAYDYSGNSNTGSAIVTIADNTSPNVIAKDTTIYLNPAGLATLTAADIDDGSTDACGISSLSLSQTNFNCSDVGSNTVTLTATDNYTNSDTDNSTVTVLDTVSPIAVAQNITVYLNPAGFVSITPAMLENGSSDACGLDSLSVFPRTFSCANLGANPVLFRAIDNNGNIGSTPAIVTVLDTVRPLAATQNITAYLDGSGNIVVPADSVNNGSTDACGIDTLILTPNTFNCTNLGANNVSLQVTDNNGNSRSASAIITILDTTGATIITQNITVYLNPAGTASITTADVDNGSNDACGPISLGVAPNTFNCTDTGSNVVTLSATDSQGNPSSGIATVTVLDTISPTAVAQNFTVYLDPAGNATVAAASINNGSSDACGINAISIDQSNFNCGDVGANGVVLTVTDNNGNSSNDNASITVIDTVDPNVITQNITLYLDGTGSATLLPSQIDNGSTDACGIGTRAVVPNSFNCSDIGANSVTLTITDNNGNSKNGTATVTVVDTVGPTAIAQNITVYLNPIGSVSVSASQVDNGSNDACGSITRSLSQTVFNCSETGANNVILTVTDAGGNMSTAPAVITVLDTISPVANAQNITAYLNPAGTIQVDPNLLENGSSDACGIDSVSVLPRTFNCSNVGSNPVTFIAYDNNGNSGSTAAVINILDTVSPSVSTQNINIYLNTAGNVNLAPALVDNGSADACGVATLSVAPNNFNCSDIGPNGVILTVTDQNGNSNTGPATVTVLDTVAPTVITQTVNVPLDPNGIAVINAPAINNGSFDACGIASITSDPDTFTCTETGPQVVTLSVTDIYGNVGIGTETVIIIETVPPVAVSQNFTAYLDPTGNVNITGADIDGGSSDNCALDTLLARPNQFDCAERGANPVWLVVSDLFGSKDSALATVTVVDTVGPNVITQPATLYLDASGNATLNANQVDNGSNDPCGVAGYSVWPNTFSCADTGANVVSLTVTDNDGNSRSGPATVFVRDTISPNIQTQTTNVYLNFGGVATLNPLDIDNGSSDACGIASRVVVPTSFNCLTVGPQTVNYLVTDFAGNSSFAQVTINVIDTIKPVPFSQNVTAYLDASGSVTVNPSDLNNGSLDACGVTGFSLDQSIFGCSDVGPNNVILTVSDPSLNSDTSHAIITILDTISPQVITQNVNLYLDANGLGVITPSMIDNGSIEACGLASSVLDIDSFFCSDVGANTVMLTLTDNNGNSSSATATVTVIDTVSPNVVTQNITVYLNNSGMVSIMPTDLDNGSSDACGIDSLSLSQRTFDCSHVGPNQVSLLATDNNSNVGSGQATVTVLDTLRPIIISRDDTVYLDGSGNAIITSAQVNNGSTDNCSVSLSLSDSLFDCMDIGNNLISLNGIDPSNNTNFSSVVITVLDTVSPTLMLQDITVYLDGSGSASISAADIDLGSSDNCSLDPLVLDTAQFDCSMVGANIVTVQGSDPTGNTSIQSITVTVIDSISPTITCPSNISQGNDPGQCGAQLSIAVPVNIDNCSVLSFSNDYNSTQDASDFYPVGLTQVTYMIEDVNGNQNSCSFSVEIIDNEIPDASQAGPDQVVCKDDAVLSGNIPGMGIGAWTLVSGSGQIDNSNSPQTNVNQLGLGQNVFEWSITGPCSINRDTVEIELVLLTVAASASDLDVLDGDQVQLDASTNVGNNGDFIWTPSLGLDDPTIQAPLLTAIQTTTYVVTYTDTQGCSNSDSVVINVTEVNKLDPIKGFSPNNDGVNDYWRIRGASNFPNNEVNVFNRWGNLVFKETGYDNLTKVFDGRSNQLDTWGSNELPEGTYYYTIDPGDGSEAISGSVVLKR